MTIVAKGSFLLHLELTMQQINSAKGGWISVLIVCGAQSVVSDLEQKMLMLPADSLVTKAKVCA